MLSNSLRYLVICSLAILFVAVTQSASVAEGTPGGADTEIRAGEIQLEGRVQSVSPAQRQMLLAVVDFTLADGKSASLPYAKAKIVLLNGNAVLRAEDGAPLEIAAANIGRMATVVGPDSGVGHPLLAREVTLGDPVQLSIPLESPDSTVNDANRAPTPMRLPSRSWMPNQLDFSNGKIILEGRMSTFGGPLDGGVKPYEGLALAGECDIDRLRDYFLPEQPTGTTGLARRLNPASFYIACRWDARTPKFYLSNIMVKVVNPATGAWALAKPMDWGPNQATGRVADLSPGLAHQLGLGTNDACTVEIPLP